MKFVLRGLEGLGKAMGQLTVLLLVAVLVGAPVVALHQSQLATVTAFADDPQNAFLGKARHELEWDSTTR
jgi:hypothetical protein